MPSMPLVRRPLPFLVAVRHAGFLALSATLLLGGCGPSGDGSPGTGGSTGSAGASGGAGTTGAAGTSGSAGTTGTGGSVSTAGTGGAATGTAGTTGSAGTGGSIGSAGTGGSATGGIGGSTGTGGGGGRGGSAGGAAGRGGGGGSAGAGGSTGTGGGAGATGSGGAGGGGTCPVIADFTTAWPSGKGPADLGPKAVSNFKSYLGGMLPITSSTYGGAGYALAFTWFGALRFSKFVGDTTNNTYFIQQFEPYASGSVTVNNAAPTGATVDERAFGDLPLEIYQQNMDARCKTIGLARADVQWQSPTNGITRDARYWADDMYMITMLQVDAYRVTKDPMYLTRAAVTLLDYQAKLQQSDGLFWHTQTSKAYWGRANGWVAAGAAELLVDLPAGTQRDMVMAGFKKHLDGLLTKQVSGGNDDGMWRQVLDVSTANPESSCTAMFTFALTTALKNGWISGSNYSMAARRGWLAVANKTNAQGQLDRVCPGTGAAPAGTLASQQQFYTSITLGSNDTHGQAPLLWLSHALLRTDCPGMR